VFGKDMTVRAAGQTQVATRPGSMIVTNLGSPPGMPTILAQGALNAQLGALEGRRGTQSSSGSGGSGARNPDHIAQSSGLSGINSGQSVRIIAPGVPDNFGSGPGPRNRNPNDTIVTALSDANQSTQTNTSKQTQTPTQPQTQEFRLPTHDDIDLGLFNFRGLGLDFNGRLATISELANLNQQRATATYNGPVQAFVNNNFNNPVGGTYQNVWNFGNRNGIVTVKLDSSTYGGGSTPNVSLAGNGPFFSSNGAIKSTGGPAGRSMNVDGLFVSTPSGGPAKQQVGVISATGPNNYSAIGAFVGTR
jgi:hypothetical protein